jgi:glucosamine--fructose-6-phosphate aminotransferase (isomerizing)
VAIHLGRRTGTLTPDAAAKLCTEFAGIPHKMVETLEGLGDMAAFAQDYKDARDFLFLGRGTELPDRARGCAEAEGDLVHPRRGLRAGRDETWPDRPGR